MGLAAAGECAPPRFEHLIVVGVDGFGARAVREGRMPNLRALMDRGASTLEARAVIPTVSSPNWASMIMGAGPAQHGITSNEWQADKFTIGPTCKGSGGFFPTVFGLLHEQKPGHRIAIFHDWKDYGRLVEPGAVAVKQHVKGSREAMTAALEDWRARKSSILFIHLDDVDHAGHDKGWWGTEYFEMVSTIDGLIGQAAAAADSKTLVLVTADHGGSGTRHGGLSMDEIEIPWVIAGPGVRKGHRIAGPVNTYDTAATIAWLFGLKTPDCWIARPVLEAFEGGRR